MFSIREKNPSILTFAGVGIACAHTPSMRNTAKKILIVDSNEKFRESLREFFSGLGHEVFEAATGPEGLDKASSIHPDLIMMDIRLPGINGDEVTVQLKRNTSTRNIPVVLNSGWTTDCNVDRDFAVHYRALRVKIFPMFGRTTFSTPVTGIKAVVSQMRFDHLI